MLHQEGRVSSARRRAFARVLRTTGVHRAAASSARERKIPASLRRRKLLEPSWFRDVFVPQLVASIRSKELSDPNHAFFLQLRREGLIADDASVKLNA